jgi:TrmH family RNA methyltransferase
VSELLTFSNPKIQRLRRLLGRRSARVEEGAFAVEGPSLIGQAFTNGWEVEALFVAHGTVPESLGLPEALQRANVAIHYLDDKVIERVASTETPQPLIASVRTRATSLGQLAGTTFVLVGDHINDPGNAGTMLRSAEAAGADAVVFTTGSVDVYNPKTVRASAGALFTVPVVADVALEEVLALDALRSYGTTSHGGTSQGSGRYTDVDLTSPSMIVVGNEAHGLSPDTSVDEWITIPHRGRAESLNVAMAATLLVFEVARQRGAR